jgi:hypothetical protein
MQSTSCLGDLDYILKVIDTFDEDPAGFLHACASARIKPIVDPFWKDLPYAHIFHSITPDILHQIYQGLINIISWITSAVRSEEVDVQCRHFPPNHKLQSFTKGITSLSQLTGQEHNQMCHILQVLVMDVPLALGASNTMLVQAIWAILDFALLAQYLAHTCDTLQLLEDALSHFYSNKKVFVNLSICQQFNLPKLHFASHYVDLIKLYGTTDNFNTEYTECLHIDLAKNVFAAVNSKDEFPQMTVWLEHQEKIHRHDHYIKWQLDGSPPIVQPCHEWQCPGLKLDHKLQTSKHPSIWNVTLEILETEYGAKHFCTALQWFVVLTNSLHTPMAQVEHCLWDVNLPCQCLPVWHRIKYLHTDIYMDVTQTADTIHAHPKRLGTHGHHIPG